MKKRVMISQCLGNIGNQLFCLFSGYYAAKKFSGNGYDIYFVQPEICKHNKPIKEFESFMFDNSLPKDVKYCRFDDKVTLKSNPNLFEHDCEMASTIYSPISTNNSNGVFVYGYRQNPNYWNNDVNFVRKYIKPINGIIEYIKEKYNNIDFSNSVCVNVRRGDYTRDLEKQALGLLGIQWFKNALDLTNKKNVIIVSDDIEWCKKNFDSSYTFVNEDSSKFNKVAIDFWIQTISKTNIIQIVLFHGGLLI